MTPMRKVRQLRPLRQGNTGFSEEASDLVAEIEFNTLRHLDAGLPGLTARLVPHLEEEAIARMRHAGLRFLEDNAKQKAADITAWRHRWAEACAHFLATDVEQHPESLMRSAANVVVSCARLREAIDAGHAERAAAYAVLVISWVSIGGVSTSARIDGQKGGRASARTRKESARVPAPAKLRQIRDEMIAAGTDSRAVAAKLATRYSCTADHIRKEMKKRE